jgi:hypothetical protein
MCSLGAFATASLIVNCREVYIQVDIATDDEYICGKNDYWSVEMSSDGKA